nr:MAG TPA: hypothetical protein [Caudoviricetes sp.]
MLDRAKLKLLLLYADADKLVIPAQIHLLGNIFNVLNHLGVHRHFRILLGCSPLLFTCLVYANISVKSRGKGEKSKIFLRQFKGRIQAVSGQFDCPDFLYHWDRKRRCAMNYFANPYQGYGSPYGYPSAAPQGAAGAPQAFGGQVTRVNGRNGADAFRMAPNSSILLMDENDPIVWLKQTDGAGYATVTPYTVTPYQVAAPVDMAGLETRVKRLEEMLSGKPDDADAPGKRKQNAE